MIKTPKGKKIFLVFLSLPPLLPSPATARRCGAWRWLVVVSSAKQKQQLHHQQLTNGSTILKTFTFPEFLDLFNLSTVFFGSILANILSDLHTEDVAFRRTKGWWTLTGYDTRVGGSRLSRGRFNLQSLMSVAFAKKVSEKGVRHNKTKLILNTT